MRTIMNTSASKLFFFIAIAAVFTAGSQVQAQYHQATAYHQAPTYHQAPQFSTPRVQGPIFGQVIGNRLNAVGQNFVENITPKYVAPHGHNTTTANGVVSALGQGAHLGTQIVDAPGHGINAAEQLFGNGSQDSQAFFDGMRTGNELLNPMNSVAGRGFRAIGEAPEILTKHRKLKPSTIVTGLVPGARFMNPVVRDARNQMLNGAVEDLRGMGINAQPLNQAYQRTEQKIVNGFDRGLSTAGNHVKRGAQNVGNWSTQKFNNGKAHAKKAGNSVKNGFNNATRGIGKLFGK